MTAAEHAAEASALLQRRERVPGSGITSGPREVDARIAQAHALTALALIEVEQAKPVAVVHFPPGPLPAQGPVTDRPGVGGLWGVGGAPFLDTPAPRRRRRRWRRSRP